MNQKYLLSLDEVNNSDLDKIGGKARGLHEILDFTKEASVKSGIDFTIPKTYVITSDFFEEIKGNMYPQEFYLNIDKVNFPQKFLNELMQKVVELGGNIALRSSANVEDKFGKTYSGHFKSVLNVSTKKELNKALIEIYKSTYEKEFNNDIKMSVILQPMYQKPYMAGVVYTETFLGDPQTVINYVQNKNAEQLLAGTENGNISMTASYFEINGKSYLKDLDNIDKDLNYQFIKEDYARYKDSSRLGEILKKDLQSSHVTFFANSLAKKSGYAIDMEFCVPSIDSGIVILQQRPYVTNANFKMKQIEDNVISGFFKNQPPVIKGEVVVVDSYYWDKNIKLDTKNKIILFSDRKTIKDFKTKDDYELYTERKIFRSAKMMNNNSIQDEAKLIIDTIGTIKGITYTHYVNELREKGVPFLIVENDEAFLDVKTGDSIELNMHTGKHKHLPKQKSRLKNRTR